MFIIAGTARMPAIRLETLTRGRYIRSMPPPPKAAFPAHRGFLKNGYRVRNAKSAGQGHWQGGVAYHRNAISPITKRPFTLLWDINCKDPRFRGAFGTIERIPLYYEWPCCASFSYKVVSQDEIELIQFSGNYQGDDFPYPEFKDSFERCPIDLELIPPDVEEILMRLESRDIPEAWMEKENIAKAQLWLGRKIQSTLDLGRQQFGGVPSMTQGDP
jgi:hypothetical protein